MYNSCKNFLIPQKLFLYLVRNSSQIYFNSKIYLSPQAETATIFIKDPEGNFDYDSVDDEYDDNYGYYEQDYYYDETYHL